MRGYHTTSRKSYPVKTHRKLIRSVRGKFRYKYKSASERTNSISVTLKDLGDIDVKELNTIPSSIVDEEVLSWIDVPDLNAESATCPNPLLQVNSGKFCPMCTADLVKICGNDTPSSLTCSHMEQNEDEVLAKARSFFEKNMIHLWNTLGENMPVGEGKGLQQIMTNKDKNEIVKSKKEGNRKLFSRGVPPENEITCSMSKLSMQAYLCTSESTISAVISEAVQTPPSLFVWSSSSDEKLFGQSAEGGKLKLLCGELLLQLCKATAGKSVKRQAADHAESTLNANFPEGNKMVQTSTSTPDGNVDGHETAVTQQLPDWLKEITGVKSQPGVHQKYDFASQGEAVKLKTPSKSFKPLLCTKLSVPWRGRKHSTQQHALYLKTQPKMNYPDYNCTLTNSVSSLVGLNSFKSELPDKEPTKMDVVAPERNDMKPKKDMTKKKNKEFKESDVCPKCKISMRSDHHNNPINIKTKQNKGRRGKGRSVKRNRRISKDRHAKRRISSTTHRGAKQKASDTKYFIKSFFTGTSSETTPKTKSNEKTSRNLLLKPNARRKKSTFTLPHSVTMGQAGFNYTKKRPDEEIDIRQLQGKAKSKNDVETLMNKELKMISKHVKAHEKHNIHTTNAPLFHTCFKNMLSHELKNKGGHAKKPAIVQKECFHPRKVRGNVAGAPQKIEKRKFNDSLFSCLIPRVFK
ncbi:hypothetical protein GE061_019357 [Apolygus lucorum]|uniref:Uncharacterized protein n=1 Tax=Apolygus lucorum TaxID=248454 RepID=A0A6A4JJ78_APOLU|nr:hypothetical protein GE061_019357 [Apolygus lucorum]